MIITALLSAANSGLFAASRMMWSLSHQKQLPQIFSKVNARGIPYIAVMVTMLGAMPGLLSEQFAPETIFKNLLGVAAFTMVVVWMSICLSQFNFRPLSSRGLGHRPFTAATRVRIPVGTRL